MVLIYLSFFLIAFANFICGAFKNKSKVLYGFALITIFILMTFNYEGPDIGVYLLTYENIGNATANVYQTTYMEWGYTTLMILSNKMGLDFYAFRIILTFICLLLFNSTVKYYKVNGNLIIGLYMTYLFFFDAIQLRNCIVQFIILFATRYLFKKSWSSTIKYILCVIIAASIHTLAWLYLSFLLIKVSRKQSFFDKLLKFTLLLFLVCIVTKPVFLQVVNIISEYIGHGSGYLHSSISYGYWVVLALHLIGIVPLTLFKKKLKDADAQIAISYIVNINIILCLFLPLTLINNNFNRIFRNNMILTLIGLTLVYMNSKSNLRSKQAAMVSLLSLTAGWYFSDMLRYEIGKIINPIFEKNLIFTFAVSENIIQYLLVASVCMVVILIMRLIIKKCKQGNVNKNAGRIKCSYR